MQKPQIAISSERTRYQPKYQEYLVTASEDGSNSPNPVLTNAESVTAPRMAIGSTAVEEVPEMFANNNSSVMEDLNLSFDVSQFILLFILLNNVLLRFFTMYVF